MEGTVLGIQSSWIKKMPPETTSSSFPTASTPCRKAAEELLPLIYQELSGLARAKY